LQLAANPIIRNREKGLQACLHPVLVRLDEDYCIIRGRMLEILVFKNSNMISHLVFIVIRRAVNVSVVGRNTLEIAVLLGILGTQREREREREREVAAR
jgi:hypothetical protein